MEASVLNNVYTENNLEVWYYEEPTYKKISTEGSPLNLETPLFTLTDFKWGTNDLDKLKKYGNMTCRFQSVDGSKILYTKAKMEVYPI